MKKPLFKYEVVRHEQILGETMFMGEYKYKKKVTWYVELENLSDYHKLDELAKLTKLNGDWYKTKKEATEVCELLNWFYSQDNLYEAYSHEKTKRLLKLKGNTDRFLWKERLRAYEINKPYTKKRNIVIVFQNMLPLFTITCSGYKNITDEELFQGVKAFYADMYDESELKNLRIVQYKTHSVIKFTLCGKDKELDWDFFANMMK